MNLDDALQTFFAESREMLEDMERLLLDLENQSDDPEQLDALFRCVHTIKGSAGLFGLDHVVEFTHVVENVLDRLRDSEITLDAKLAAVLLESRDHIATLIELEPDQLSSTVTDTGAQLLSALSIYQSPADEKLSVATSDPSKPERIESSCTETWHISVRFGTDILCQGMDPAGFIRYLGGLGKISYITTVTDGLPEAKHYDPESCYLGFEIDLEADTTKAAIEDVFEFVREDCSLRILSPRSELQHYIDLIQQLPEDDARLGEILMASGALTHSELEHGLKQQADTKADAEKSAPIGEVLVNAGAVDPEVVTAALGKQQKARQSPANANRYIRVQADRLDSLINLVGELVIASAAAGISAQRNGDVSTCEAIANVESLVEEIRDGSLELRMVPIGETFQRFQRVVRDVSNELEKDIALRISGADTELDKTVVEKIADPLMHLIRNAMDHGIESSDCRLEAGKPQQGTVCLNAFHEAGSIVIEVTDDGGGIDGNRIWQKAIEKGVIGAEAELSDAERLNLIFEPGFSTAESVTNLSGRGVGMDVVRRNIEALRGTVDVKSMPQVGSTFRIRLPLTLAIIDGFLTGVGEARYVIPLETVVECIELAGEQRKEVQHRDFINLRGEVLPFIRLRDYFDLDSQAGRRENIIVVNYGGNKAGLIVDALLGEHQTVIKPLGRLFSNLSGISGSTILGSGEVALILDIPSLVQRAVEGEGDENRRQSPTLPNQKSNKLPAR